MIQPQVVLVRPKYSLNVGYVARVMANMGGDRLILIDPQCEIDHNARMGAAGAQQRLIETTIYSSLADFFAKEPEGVRIAFFGREKKEKDATAFRDRLEMLNKDEPQWLKQPHYLFFGAEDNGLSDEDVKLMNFIVPLPTFGEFKSLNLSHAVLLALYIYQDAVGQKFSLTGENVSAANSANCKSTDTQEDAKFIFPESALKEWLQALGFQLDNRDRNAYTVLKRLLLQRLATAKELRMLESIVQQTVRKLKNNK